MESEQTQNSTLSIREQVWDTVINGVIMEDAPTTLLNDEVALLEEQYMNMAEYNLKERATIFSIAEKEGLLLTQDEYTEYYTDYLITFGFDSVSELIEAVGEDTLKTSILTNSVKDFLVANVVQTDK